MTPREPEIWLLRAVARKASSGASVTVNLAGGGKRGYTQFATRDWKAGLARPPAIIQKLGFSGAAGGDGGGFGDGAIVQALSFEWRGRAKDAAALAALYWRDATFELWTGPDGGTDAAMTKILVGRIAECTAEPGGFKLNMVDPALALDVPVLSGTFAGTGDLEGPAELKGQPKWRAWGQVFNVTLRSLDPANNIWVATDPARKLQAIDQVYDRGNAASALTVIAWAGSEAATLAALRQASTPQGGGAVAPSIGCIKWWFANPGRLTADLRGEIGSAYVDRPADIAAALVNIAGGPTVNAAMLAAARAARNAESGWLVADESTTIVAEITKLLSGVSLWWGLSAAGIVEIGTWEWGSSVATFAAARIDRTQSFKPVKKVPLGWRRNQTVMARGDIAAAVFWNEVSGSGRPADNATVGATAGADLRASSGTVLADKDVITGAATAAPGGMLPNWNLDIADAAGLPAYIKLVQGNTSPGMWSFGDANKNTLKLHVAGAYVGVGYPAIPVDDRQKYIVRVRHRSTGAAGGAFYLRINERNAALPSGETHVTADTRTSIGSGLVENGPMPGVDWVEHQYIYTPTAGALFATVSFYNWSSGVAYELDWVQFVPVLNEGRINALALLNGPAQAGADKTINNIAGGLVGGGPGATASAAQVLNSYVPFGQNLIPNSDQTQRQNLMLRWNPDGAVLPWGPPQHAISGFQGWTEADYILAGNLKASTVYQDGRVSNPANGGIIDYDINKGDGVRFRTPCIPGEKMLASAYFGAHRCGSQVIIAFEDTGGTLLNYGVSPVIAGLNNLQSSLGNMGRASVSLVAPASAATASVIVRKLNTDVGQASSYWWCAGIMLERAAANQSEPSPYMPGPPSNTRQLGYTGHLNADVTAQNIAAGFLGAGPGATASADQVLNIYLYPNLKNDGRSLNGNADFGVQTGAAGSPPDGLVNAAGGMPFTKVVGEVSPNAYRRVGAAGADSYAYFAPLVNLTPGGWYYVYAHFKIKAGTSAGVGLHLSQENTAGGQVFYENFAFQTSEDNTKTVIGNGVVDRLYRVELPVKISSNPTIALGRLYVMEHWSVLGSTAAANEIEWHLAGIRPAKPEEIATLTTIAGQVQRLGAADGRAADGRILNSSNNFGLRALSEIPTFSQTNATSSVTLNLGGNGRLYSDWGATIVLPSATIHGLAFSTLYYLWRNMPPDGAGTSYGYSTAITDALGVGKVYLGYLNTMSSGGAGGGGGGFGGENCVADAAWVPIRQGLADGFYTQAANVTQGQGLFVLADDLEGLASAHCEANVSALNNCVTLTSESGIALTLALNTPMTLPGGYYEIAANMLGRPVAVMDQNGLRWERVTQVDYVGERAVAGISCNNGTYAAGDQPGRYMFSHNGINKP